MEMPTKSEKQARREAVKNLAYLAYCFKYEDEQLSNLIVDALIQKEMWYSGEEECKGKKMMEGER